MIAEPFKHSKIAIGEGTAAKLADAADCYPYFLQVYSGAAWEAVAGSGIHHLGPDQVEESVRRGKIWRETYYNDRYEELDESGALTLARCCSRTP